MKKNILIGITGGIAIYKICSLVNLLIKEGHDVKIIMTNAATKFVSPLTFQTLTNNKVHLDMFDLDFSIDHISLAKWADIFLIAPATCNVIGKMANGIADNLLTSVFMAIPKNKNVLIAPAMNMEMWSNEILQKNIQTLSKNKKHVFIQPRKGILACGDFGQGKIADNADILETIKKYF